MAIKTKQWSVGSGSVTIQYNGQGDGDIIITSNPNSLFEARSMQIIVETTDGSGIQRVVTVNQAAKQRIDLSAAVVTASNQTYNGSAKTPTPTVTLNGNTVPSTGYDVSYSNNTNAGTANITITGKGDYTGTAYGTFTINKATPTYTAPTARSLTYNGSSQYLTTSGSTNHGTIKYSLDGVNWYTTRRQGSTAGTYTSYWKLEGDSNHTDINSTSINTTIAKASRTLSFADTYMVLNTSSTGTKTATPSAGSGDGAITYSIANTTYATINSSTGAVTAKTSDGSVIVTATIAAGTNYLSASASYTLYVFATTHNYSYSGSAKNVTLPPGTYQFQCWGAQGASCSDGYSGGKGGYSVGQLTIANTLAIQVLVGGQNGYNGGGSTIGSSSYNSGDTYGRSSMGGGGGASDIRLSDGALLSRMIVAGGGSGGAYCYKEVTTHTPHTENILPSDSIDSRNIWPSSYEWENGTVDYGQEPFTYNRCRSVFIYIGDGADLDISVNSGWKVEVDYYNHGYDWLDYDGWLTGSTSVSIPAGAVWIKLIFARTDDSIVSPSDSSSVASLSLEYLENWKLATITTLHTELDDSTRCLTKDYIDIERAERLVLSVNSGWNVEIDYYDSSYSWIDYNAWSSGGTYTPPSNARYIKLIYKRTNESYVSPSDSANAGNVTMTYTTSSTSKSSDYQSGYAGGGTTGAGYSSTYQGKQNAAGSGGSFGQGASQSASNYRYCSGAGGGGWYGGGGGQYSDNDMSIVHLSGGGSGFVNTAASAGNRPSGYTGLELESGTTYAGNTSFPAPGGGNETGHSGDGYIRITRIS